MRARCTLPLLACVSLATSACVVAVEPLADRDTPSPSTNSDPPPDDPNPEDPDPEDPSPDEPKDPDEPAGPLPIDGSACDAHRDALEAIAAQLDAERASLEIPGAAIAIVVDDCLFARGFGVEHAGGAPVDAHTRFQLASLTKTLTAITAVSLEEDGVLDRGAPLSSLVSTTSTASLDDLLAHRAGYPTDVAGYDDDLAAFVDANASAPMWAPPNEVWLYSNPGFAVAGRALEVAADEDFASLVRTRVFERAGMEDALMGAELTGDESAMATGHSGAEANPELVAPTDLYLTTGYYGPMGGAFASAADLARLMHAFTTDVMVSSEGIEDLGTARGEAYGAAVGYGQGLFTAYDGTLYHGGSVAGFLCEMDVNPAARVGVTVLSAADWAFPYETLYQALYELLPAGESPPSDDDAPSDAEVVGTYRDDVVLGDITITDAGAELAITLDGETHALTYWAPGSYGFFYAPWQTELEVSFQRGSAGALYLVTLLGVGVKQ